MTKSMKLRDVERALKAHGCTVISDKGGHTKWSCPCGQHQAHIPRHKEISPGVISDTIKKLTCLPKGLLQ
jgi:predicted RNA binding protein YcfA (HicA-like mRNA interferase family)